MVTGQWGAVAQAKKPWGLRGFEQVVLAYYVYLGCLSLLRQLAPGRLLILVSAPAIIWAVCQAQAMSDRRWAEVLRDWWSLSLILPGYWAMAWFSSPHRITWQNALLRMDRMILYGGHLRSMIEVAGPVFPAVLETFYLLLYAIPPVCMGIIYVCGARSQGPRFLLLVFAGTFIVYALLPFFSVASPRVAFPNEDLPHYDGIVRHVNVWLLDHWDISTSVMPSGHVAVALSSALGLRKVLPHRPLIGRCFLAVAGLIFLATVYGRYHFAVDGLISMALVSLVFYLAGRIEEEM